MTCLIEILSHSKPGTQNSTVGFCLSGQVGANSLRSCKYVSTNPNSKKWPLLSLLTTGSALDLVSPAPVLTVLGEPSLKIVGSLAAPDHGKSSKSW